MLLLNKNQPWSTSHCPLSNLAILGHLMYLGVRRDEGLVVVATAVTLRGLTS